MVPAGGSLRNHLIIQWSTPAGVFVMRTWDKRQIRVPPGGERNWNYQREKGWAAGELTGNLLQHEGSLAIDWALPGD